MQVAHERYRQRPDDIVIDDEGSSSSRSESVIMRNTAARISFKKPFLTKKQTGKEKFGGKSVRKREKGLEWLRTL